MNVAYVRVSSRHQNTDRQRDMLKKYDIEEWFEEKESGKNTNRPEFKRMMEYVRNGDTVYIADFSRLCRSTKDLLDTVDQLKAKGVKLVSLKENLDTSTSTGVLMLTMIGAIYTFERECILERQAQGLQAARERGKLQGRPVKAITDEKWNEAYSRYMRREINKGQMCEELNISRPTLEKLLKERAEQ